MNVRIALLLTHDADFEKVVTEALKELLRCGGTFNGAALT